MSFEEEFPSLKEFMYEDMIVKSVLNHKDLQEILSKHCLDKQRVKEIIDRIMSNQIANRIAEISKCSEEIRNILNELKKELRL